MSNKITLMLEDKETALSVSTVEERDGKSFNSVRAESANMDLIYDVCCACIRSFLLLKSQTTEERIKSDD